MTKTTTFENATKFESKVDEETNESKKKNIKRLKWQNLNTERNKLIINVKNDLTWLRSDVPSFMTTSAVVMKLLNWKYIFSYLTARIITCEDITLLKYYLLKS